MNQVGVTIDAGHPPFRQLRMRRTAGCAHGADRGRIVTLAACDTIVASHCIAGVIRKLDPARIPDCRIAEIAGHFSNHILDPIDRMRIGLDEPIVRGNMAVAAARQCPGGVHPVRGSLILRVLGQRRHRMAGGAKGVRRGKAIDLRAGDDGSRACQRPHRNEG